MNLLSYVAAFVVLEAVGLVALSLTRRSRKARWDFGLLAVALAAHSACWMVVWGAEDPAWSTNAGMLAPWTLGVAALAGVWLVVAGRARGGLLVASLAGWAALVGFVPPLADAAFLLVAYVVRHPKDLVSQWQRHLPSAVPGPVVFLDRGHRVTGANPAAVRLLPNVLAPPGRDFFALIDEPEAAAQWRRAEARTELGGPLNLSPHYDRFGDFVGAVVFLEAASPWQNRLAALSPREREVAELAVQGLSNQEIADRLFLSEGTVKRHMHQILAKMGVSRREELRVLQAEGTS